MGQGRWIRKRDGHYQHYTEEEYKNTPEGKAEEFYNHYILPIMVGIFILVVIIALLVAIWNWFVGLF